MTPAVLFLAADRRGPSRSSASAARVAAMACSRGQARLGPVVPTAHVAR
jgi:hypothetical protein